MAACFENIGNQSQSDAAFTRQIESNGSPPTGSIDGSVTTNPEHSFAALPPEEVHLWTPPETPSSVSRMRAEGMEILSPRENEYLSHMKSRITADRFSLGRILMRRVLSLYLFDDPAKIAFRYNANGKPELVNPAHQPLSFNLSHTSTDIVLAVARATAIGVDVERYDRAQSTLRIARRFFSQAEIDELDALGPDASKRALQLWSLKESIVKANGDTVWDGLANVPLAIEGHRIRWGEPQETQNGLWRLTGGTFRDTNFLAIAARDSSATDDRFSKTKTYRFDREISEFHGFDPEFSS